MRKAAMLWTIPAFLAVWSAVGADLYFMGQIDGDEQSEAVVEVTEPAATPQTANLTEAVEDE
jgi:hypothetical protein